MPFLSVFRENPRIVRGFKKGFADEQKKSRREGNNNKAKNRRESKDRKKQKIKKKGTIMKEERSRREKVKQWGSPFTGSK